MKTSLCNTCDNKDVMFVLVGNNYIPKLVCAYDMVNFPRQTNCDKYAEKDSEDELAD